VAAALLLGYLKELEKTQVSRSHSLFFLCIKPALKLLHKERNLQFLCLVEITRTELHKSRARKGLHSFWAIMDRKETVLALFGLLQSTRAKAVNFFKESNTALAAWVQTCIFAAPHQNKSVEGSFNILDQILQVHPSLSPSKIESIQSFLLNVVNPRKQQFIRKSGKEKWRPTKKAMQDLIEAALQTVPTKEKLEKAKESLKKKKKEEESATAKGSLKILQREQQYLQVFARYKALAPKRRKRVNFQLKAATVKVTKIRKKKKGTSDEVTITIDSQEMLIDKEGGEGKTNFEGVELIELEEEGVSGNTPDKEKHEGSTSNQKNRRHHLQLSERDARKKKSKCDGVELVESVKSFELEEEGVSGNTPDKEEHEGSTSNQKKRGPAKRTTLPKQKKQNSEWKKSFVREGASKQEFTRKRKETDGPPLLKEKKRPKNQGNPVF